MIGAKIIVRKGNSFAMTKVAHDGNDISGQLPDETRVFENAVDQTVIKDNLKPFEVCMQYLYWRENKYGETSDFADMHPEIVYKKDFEEDVSFEEAQIIMEAEMRASIIAENLNDKHPYHKLIKNYYENYIYLDLDSSQMEIGP